MAPTWDGWGIDMACSVKEHVISSAELALELLKLWSDPKITAAYSPILLVWMNSGADPKWLEWSWLIVLWYCLGTCPRSVSVKSVSEDEVDCCYFLRSWMYNFLSESVKDDWWSLIQSAFADQCKEIAIWLEQKIKTLIPPLIYLCSVLANGVQQKHCSLNLWMWNHLSFLRSVYNIWGGLCLCLWMAFLFQINFKCVKVIFYYFIPLMLCIC